MDFVFKGKKIFSSVKENAEKNELKQEEKEIVIHQINQSTTELNQQVNDTPQNLDLFGFMQISRHCSTFGGLPNEEPDQFINDMDDFLQLHDLTENQKAIIFASRFHGYANKKMNPFITRDTVYKELKEKFQQAFAYRNNVTYEKLKNCKILKKEPFSSYAARIEKSVAYFYKNSQGYNDYDRNKKAIKVFVKGLPNPLSEYLQEQLPYFKTLDEALKQANRCKGTKIPYEWLAEQQRNCHNKRNRNRKTSKQFK